MTRDSTLAKMFGYKRYVDRPSSFPGLQWEWEWLLDLGKTWTERQRWVQQLLRYAKSDGMSPADKETCLMCQKWMATNPGDAKDGKSPTRLPALPVESAERKYYLNEFTLPRISKPITDGAVAPVATLSSSPKNESPSVSSATNSREPHVR